MAIPAGKYTIKSATGPYLGMNGSGITGPFSSGVGRLFCSNDPNSPSNPALQFYITPVAEDTNIYTIQSVAYPGVYLRMDGSGLTGYTESGGGVVNCQFGAASYEKFWIVYNRSWLHCFCSYGLKLIVCILCCSFCVDVYLSLSTYKVTTSILTAIVAELAIVSLQ